MSIFKEDQMRADIAWLVTADTNVFATLKEFRQCDGLSVFIDVDWAL